MANTINETTMRDNQGFNYGTSSDVSVRWNTTSTKLEWYDSGGVLMTFDPATEELNLPSGTVSGSSVSATTVTASSTLSLGGIVKNTAIEHTIASGAITAISSNILVDTEGDAATDDLATINGLTGGGFCILRPENVARVVTVKDGTGNIILSRGDYEMSAATDFLILSHDGSNLREIGRAQPLLDTGVWTPTVSTTTNVASSAPKSGQWSRIGDRVHFSVRVDITPDAGSTLTIFEISLPVASNLSDQNNAIASGAWLRGGNVNAVHVVGNATNDTMKAQFTTDASTSAHVVNFSGMYRVE